MENVKPMQIDVQLTENDYRRLGLLHQRKMRRTSFVVYALLFFLVVMWTNDFQWDPVFVAVGLIGGLANIYQEPCMHEGMHGFFVMF